MWAACRPHESGPGEGKCEPLYKEESKRPGEKSPGLLKYRGKKCLGVVVGFRADALRVLPGNGTGAGNVTKGGQYKARMCAVKSGGEPVYKYLVVLVCLVIGVGKVHVETVVGVGCNTFTVEELRVISVEDVDVHSKPPEFRADVFNFVDIVVPAEIGYMCVVIAGEVRRSFDLYNRIAYIAIVF